MTSMVDCAGIGPLQQNLSVIYLDRLSQNPRRAGSVGADRRERGAIHGGGSRGDHRRGEREPLEPRAGQGGQAQRLQRPRHGHHPGDEAAGRDPADRGVFGPSDGSR